MPVLQHIFFSIFVLFPSKDSFGGARHEGWRITSLYCSDHTTYQLQFPGLSHNTSSLARNNFFSIPLLCTFQGSFKSASSSRCKIPHRSRPSLLRRVTAPQEFVHLRPSQLRQRSSFLRKGHIYEEATCVGYWKAIKDWMRNDQCWSKMRTDAPKFCWFLKTVCAYIYKMHFRKELFWEISCLRRFSKAFWKGWSIPYQYIFKQNKTNPFFQLERNFSSGRFG